MGSICTYCTGEGWEDATLVLPLNILKRLPQAQAYSNLLGSSNAACTEATEISETGSLARHCVRLRIEVILQSQPMATLSTPLSHSAASGVGAGTGKLELCPQCSRDATSCSVG